MLRSSRLCSNSIRWRAARCSNPVEISDDSTTDSAQAAERWCSRQCASTARNSCDAHSAWTTVLWHPNVSLRYLCWVKNGQVIRVKHNQVKGRKHLHTELTAYAMISCGSPISVCLLTLNMVSGVGMKFHTRPANFRPVFGIDLTSIFPRSIILLMILFSDRIISLSATPSSPSRMISAALSERALKSPHTDVNKTTQPITKI